jgi:hypothetical protein
MTKLLDFLFFVWTVVAHQDALKALAAVIFGGEAIYAVLAALRLPSTPQRALGESSTPIAKWRDTRRCFFGVLCSIVLINCGTLFAYLRVWFFMKDIEKPTAFPGGHHLYLIWGCCLGATLFLLVLGVVFLRLETRLKQWK